MSDKSLFYFGGENIRKCSVLFRYFSMTQPRYLAFENLASGNRFVFKLDGGDGLKEGPRPSDGGMGGYIERRAF